VEISIFADSAEIEVIREFKSNPLIDGFTTNPTLIRKAGVSDYLLFASEAVGVSNPLPISLEVFSDDLDDMFRQAQVLSSLGNNIFVKIPITNTQGISTSFLTSRLNEIGVNVNITAIMSTQQISDYLENIDKEATNIFSVFAGRIADTGRDPIPIMDEAKKLLLPYKNSKLLWASSREVLNLIQAEGIGVDIITMTPDLISKLGSLNKDLTAFSLETVKMFYEDANKSGFQL
jgi:transaldolase